MYSYVKHGISPFFHEYTYINYGVFVQRNIITKFRSLLPKHSDACCPILIMMLPNSTDLIALTTLKEIIMKHIFPERKLENWTIIALFNKECHCYCSIICRELIFNGVII